MPFRAKFPQYYLYTFIKKKKQIKTRPSSESQQTDFMSVGRHIGIRICFRFKFQRQKPIDDQNSTEFLLDSGGNFDKSDEGRPTLNVDRLMYFFHLQLL